MEKFLFDRTRSVEETYWWFRARRDILLAVVEELVPPGAQVLDVGCGTGLLSQALRRRFRVSSMDFAPEAMTCCAEKRLPAIRASIHDLPYQDGVFDLVGCFDVLYHRSAWPIEKALEELHRVLKPGGAIVVAEPAHQWLYGDMDILDHARKRFAIKELAAYLGEAGFAIRKMGYFNAYLAPLIVAIRLYRRLLNFVTPWRKPVVEYGVLPVWMNGFLASVFRAETPRVLRGGFPFGISILCVADK